MSKLQAIIYLIVALGAFAVMSFGFYKLMVYVFTYRFKNK
jgi:uncharacterized membrane protein